nr:MAG TPA: Nucleolar protein 12 (25kDa) [Caudoviricetes sp.]
MFISSIYLTSFHKRKFVFFTLQYYYIPVGI